ncbi:MAG: hypothetical protein JAZ15_04730, partial [Candidatus Thiodiazotropha endolucinida]|nr:hypothetical protein [Candidatus Thiodiazotropha taylori]MCW4312305.1 hypothetical protein [Candidatus Thiodiazotropha taylori]
SPNRQIAKSPNRRLGGLEPYNYLNQDQPIINQSIDNLMKVGVSPTTTIRLHWMHASPTSD